MTIEKIYSELGQTLFNIAPNLDGPINFVIFLRDEKNSSKIAWVGDMIDGNSFPIRGDITFELPTLVQSLKKCFESNDMGKWDLLHFILQPKTGKFDVKFEYSEDDQSEFDFYSIYIDRFMNKSIPFCKKVKK